MEESPPGHQVNRDSRAIRHTVYLQFFNKCKIFLPAKHYIHLVTVVLVKTFVFRTL